MGGAGMVQRLEGEPGGHAAVADHCDGARVPPEARIGDGHAKCSADGGARVAGTEGVVVALVAAQEPRQSAALADGRQSVAPAREDLVRIALVSDVPHDGVVRCLEHVVQCHRQFDGAEPGGEVAAARRDALDQMGAHFIGECRQLRRAQPADVGRRVDRGRAAAARRSGLPHASGPRARRPASADRAARSWLDLHDHDGRMAWCREARRLIALARLRAPLPQRVQRHRQYQEQMLEQPPGPAAWPEAGAPSPGTAPRPARAPSTPAGPQVRPTPMTEIGSSGFIARRRK